MNSFSSKSMLRCQEQKAEDIRGALQSLCSAIHITFNEGHGSVVATKGQHINSVQVVQDHASFQVETCHLLILI